jgi:phytanoyl-CoA hydroxylase
MSIDPLAYREQGFAVCRRLFRPDEIGAILAEAKGVFAAQMRRHGLLSGYEVGDEMFTEGMFRLFDLDLPAFIHCGKQAQHLISLHRLSVDPRILDELHSLGLAWPNISTRPVLYFNHRRLAKKEVYWRLALHQDWRSMQGSLDAVVVWLPLVAVDRALGALEVVAGSHRWGLLAADIVDGYGHITEAVQDRVASAGLQSVELTPGDALFFSAFLVHRSGTNVTDLIRWSCHFRYNNLRDATFVERGFPNPYTYAPGAELLTPGFPTRAEVEQAFDPGRDED